MITQQEIQTIADNIARVRARIAEAALSSGRRPEDVTLVAATKMNDADRVRAARACGIDAAGENRVQELLTKYDEGAYGDTPLHFIGTLQTNKVKYLVGKTALIESVGSVRLGRAIAKEAAKHGLRQDILVEVNIGREAAKSGIDPGEAGEAVALLAQEPSLHVCGLMAIPPISDGSGKNNRYFAEMQQLFVDISAKKYDNVDMGVLSMGMSADYADAIAYGANMVRVGSAIFGARRY